MARILLIDPCGWQGGVNSENIFPNIGIAYLTSSLHACGHEVYVIDMNNEPVRDDDVIRIMSAEHISIVGISVKTATLCESRRLGCLLKQHFNCVVIVGGAHASLVGDKLAQEDWVDYVFLGDAEENLPQLCSNLDNNREQSIAGVIQRGGTQANPVYVHNLDDLTFPDYNLFPNSVKDSVKHNYPLITSRGCVYDCIYCSVPIISGKRFRKRSTDNIIAELKMAVEYLGIKEFCIIDDAFNLDMVRAKEFCRSLIEHNLRLRWTCPNGIRADRNDDELAVLMAQSGCYSVMLGVESGDPNVFSSICKGETLEDVSNGIKVLQGAGIHVGGFFLIGLPGDCITSQYCSIKFAQNHGIVAHFNMLIPYPGTSLWDWVMLNGKILRDIEHGLHFADSRGKVLPVFETDDFSESERQMAYEMVHTRVSRFELLVPKICNGWKRKLLIFLLLLKHDRVRILGVLTKYIYKLMRWPVKMTHP